MRITKSARSYQRRNSKVSNFRMEKGIVQLFSSTNIINERELTIKSGDKSYKVNRDLFYYHCKSFNSMDSEITLDVNEDLIQYIAEFVNEFTIKQENIPFLELYLVAKEINMPYLLEFIYNYQPYSMEKISMLIKMKNDGKDISEFYKVIGENIDNILNIDISNIGDSDQYQQVIPFYYDIIENTPFEKLNQQSLADFIVKCMPIFGSSVIPLFNFLNPALINFDSLEEINVHLSKILDKKKDAQLYAYINGVYNIRKTYNETEIQTKLKPELEEKYRSCELDLKRIKETAARLQARKEIEKKKSDNVSLVFSNFKGVDSIVSVPTARVHNVNFFVTLVGAGGVGKTRIAFSLASGIWPKSSVPSASYDVRFDGSVKATARLIDVDGGSSRALTRALMLRAHCLILVYAACIKGSLERAAELYNDACATRGAATVPAVLCHARRPGAPEGADKLGTELAKQKGIRFVDVYEGGDIGVLTEAVRETLMVMSPYRYG